MLLKDALLTRCSIVLTAKPLLAPTLKKIIRRRLAPSSSVGIMLVSHAPDGQLLLSAIFKAKASEWHWGKWLAVVPVLASAIWLGCVPGIVPHNRAAAAEASVVPPTLPA